MTKRCTSNGIKLLLLPLIIHHTLKEVKIKKVQNLYTDNTVVTRIFGSGTKFVPQELFHLSFYLYYL